MTMTLIETKTLGADAVEIEFTSVPQDGTDLVLFYSLRSDRVANVTEIELRLNGSTSNRTSRMLQGSGGGTSTAAHTSGRIALSNAASSTANTFGSGFIYLANYSGSTNKSGSIDGVSENNATEAFQGIYAFLWSDTSAITSVAIRDIIANLVVGSTVSLYKVTKGSDGIVTTS